MKYLIVVIFLFSCKTVNDNWIGGRIDSVGSYKTEKVYIEVSEIDQQITFFMVNDLGDTLIKNDKRFNKYQRWALHLDQSQNLWVFSSDIGHSVWRQNSNNTSYTKTEFKGSYNIDSIPNDVYKTSSSFYPFEP